MQPISQTPYDQNNKLLVRYSSHGLNKKLLVCLNNKPFDLQTILDHSNTKLVRNSDPHCISIFLILTKFESKSLKIAIFFDYEY